MKREPLRSRPWSEIIGRIFFRHLRVALTISQTIFRLTTSHNVRHWAVAFIGLVACLLGMWAAARAGFSHLLSDYALENNLPALASEAVHISPSNPKAHYARAVVLSNVGQLSEATGEFESAVALRPGDYILWLSLGSARNQGGDSEGALAAFKEAAHLAPYYARPHWEIGHLLLQAGRRDEAFEELRRAVASRPALLLGVIDLAWETYSGEARAVQRAVQPQTGHERLVLAQFIAEHGQTDEAMQLFREAGEIPDSDRRSLLTVLLNAKRFTESYEVWSGARNTSGSERGGGTGAVTDGGFEGRIVRDDPGFGWQVARHPQAVSVSLDTDRPRAGAHSLLLRFDGDSNPSAQVITQLVLVAPKTRYRLSFAARTEEVVTGGPPVVIVTDASSSDGRTLAQSAALPQGTSVWRDYTVEFTTRDATEGVVIAIQRQHCTGGPCPIFGRVWFDAFSLQRLS